MRNRYLRDRAKIQKRASTAVFTACEIHEFSNVERAGWTWLLFGSYADGRGVRSDPELRQRVAQVAEGIRVGVVGDRVDVEVAGEEPRHAGVARHLRDEVTELLVPGGRRVPTRSLRDLCVLEASDVEILMELGDGQARALMLTLNVTST